MDSEERLRSEFLSPLQHNLIKFLEGSGPISRRDLVKNFGCPRTTLYDNLLKLQKRKIVEKFTRSNGKRGRPVVYWRCVELVETKDPRQKYKNYKEKLKLDKEYIASGGVSNL